MTFISAAVLALAAAGLGAWYAWQRGEDVTAPLFAEEGEVTVSRGGSTYRFEEPQVFQVRGGDWISTQGHSRALLVLSPSASVVLESDCHVSVRRLSSSNGGAAITVLQIERGESFHQLGASSINGQYEIVTPAATVTLSAGRHWVRVTEEGETVVEVSEGVADVTACDTRVQTWSGEYTSIVPGRAPSVPRPVVARFLSVSERTGNPDIWLREEEGAEVQLTHDKASDLAPVWSPDGGRIAFVTSRDGDKEIYVMDADGSNQVNLTGNAADDQAPAWSPDGSLIAFESLRDGARDIYVMNTDGTEQVRLTSGPGLCFAPHWDVGGSEIVFSRIESDTNGDGTVDVRDMASFFVVEADGGIPQAFWKMRFVYDEMVYPWARRGVG